MAHFPANVGGGIQNGTKSVAVASSGVGSATVTFDNAFPSTPTVVATLNTTLNRHIVLTVGAISTTGFTIKLYNYGSSVSAENLDVNWIATYN